MGTLSGKNVFVTGTSQGIGAAISNALIEAGCNLCMHYFHSVEVPQKLQKLAESKNQKAICLQADLTNEEEAIKCVKAGAVFLGSIDVLINNSGSLVQRKYDAEGHAAGPGVRPPTGRTAAHHGHHQ